MWASILQLLRRQPLNVRGAQEEFQVHAACASCLAWNPSRFDPPQLVVGGTNQDDQPVVKVRSPTHRFNRTTLPSTKSRIADMAVRRGRTRLEAKDGA